MPWRAYRGERLILLLVVLAALALYPANSQDATRFALTESLVLDGSVRIDRWLEEGMDYAAYGGHYYSDKSPGVSLAAVPPFALLRATGAVGPDEAARGVWTIPEVAWSLRVIAVGALFLAAAFALGRLAEGLAAGTGAAVSVVFALGTLALPLAVTSFGHVGAGALAFGAFLLAWRGVEGGRSPMLLAAAGLAAGLAALYEYQAALIAVFVLAYIAARARSPAAVLWFLAGGLGPASGLLAYNAVSFGSPFRFSYSYVQLESQREGFFGIGAPSGGNLVEILFSAHGLVTETPVLVVAAGGLVLLWRAGRRGEAALCGATAVLFLLLDSGYYLPFGGASPGPRFFAPALPFLAAGLAPALMRWPLLTSLAALASVVLMTFDSATSGISLLHPGLVGFEETIWSIAGAPRPLGAALVFAAAAAAVALAVKHLQRAGWRAPSRLRLESRHPWRTAAAASRRFGRRAA